MNRIRINDPTLKRLLIEHIVEQIDGGNIDYLLRAGYSPEFLDDLRRRPTRDLIHLAHSQLDILFSISEHCIDSGLRLLDMRRSHAEMREYFIIHGATRRMVCSYFKLSQEEYRSLREQLRPGDSVGGRTALPPERVRDEIHKAWHDIQQHMGHKPCRERIYALHKQFSDLRISALQQTIFEFSEDADLDLELELDPITPHE